MAKAQFGMIGLGTMGRNFLLNVADSGFACVGFDLDAKKRDLLVEEGKEWKVDSAASPAELIEILTAPRLIMLLVPAGPIVDSVINDLIPHLEKGDIVIDGGNSLFTDTERREAFLNEKGIEFLGVGVSGGEEGARHGASIMIGGNPDVYESVRPIFEAASAKVNGEPCAAHVGSGSAGHFVKMVHNGIEYGLMEILAETYDFMLRVLKMDYATMSATFSDWNASKLNSFLVEITADVLNKTDAETGRPLVEMVLDKAAQKGTGKWTSQAAMDLGVPIPTIDGAVSMRQISAQKEVRVKIAALFGTGHKTLPSQETTSGETVSSERRREDHKAQRARAEVRTKAADLVSTDGTETNRVANPAAEKEAVNREIRAAFNDDLNGALESLRRSLVCAFVVTYAQGLSLLQVAAEEKKFGTDISIVTKIWRGGCIIRSALLEEMSDAFAKDPRLPNLIMDEKFAATLSEGREDWHEVVGAFSRSRIPALCFGSSLAYFEAFRSARLPANLIQAQRDYFGAHTYQRTDKEGIFHTPDW